MLAAQTADIPRYVPTGDAAPPPSHLYLQSHPLLVQSGGKLELQQLLLLLKPEPEWLSLVAGGLQSCSHLVGKFQITVHKPLHIPTSENVRVQRCFIHNGLLRLGNQYQILIRGGGVDCRLQGRT